MFEPAAFEVTFGWIFFDDVHNEGNPGIVNPDQELIR